MNGEQPTTSSDVKLDFLSESPLSGTEIPPPPLYALADRLADDIKAFLKVEGTEAERSALKGSWKITVLGERGAGKTSFVKRLENNLQAGCLVVVVSPRDFPERDVATPFGFVARTIALKLWARFYSPSCIDPEEEKKRLQEERQNNNPQTNCENQRQQEGQEKNRPLEEQEDPETRKHKKALRKLLADAHALLLAPDRAAEAAIAFASSKEDFVGKYGDGLGASRSPNRFVESLSRVLRSQDKVLVLVVDDADWCDPRGRLLRSLLALDALEGAVVVLTGQREWLLNQCERVVRPLAGLQRPSRVPPTAVRGLLGHQLPLPGWSSARQIAFFDRPEPSATDGRLVWSWFCGYSDELGDQSGHKRFVRDLVLNDISRRVNQLGGSNFEEFLNNLMPGFELAYRREAVYSDHATVAEMVSNHTINGSINIPQDKMPIISAISSLLPQNARELVASTNEALRIERLWRQGKEVYNIDKLLNRTVHGHRLSRLVTYLAIDKWRDSAFGSLLSLDAWTVKSGLESESLVPDKDKIISIRSAKQLPETTERIIFRLIEESTTDTDKDLKYSILCVLKDSYRDRTAQ